MDALKEVCAIFEIVAVTPSRLGKEALLRELIRDDDEDEKTATIVRIVMELFSIALDWDRCFGIRTLSDVEPDLTRVMETPSFFSMCLRIENGDRWSKPEVLGILKSYSPQVEKWLTRALLGDLRMGVSYSLVNKLFPGHIKTFQCMLAEVIGDISNLQYPVATEEKIDGLRAIYIPGIGFRSRGGKPFHHTGVIEEEITSDLHVLEGEFYAGSLDDTKRVVMRSKSDPDPDCLERLQYRVFDMIPVDDWHRKECNIVYMDRSKRVMATFGSSTRIIPTCSLIATTAAHLAVIAQRHLEDGFEGSMVKELHGLYTWKRSSAWLKYKPVEEGDFEIISVYPGSGRNKDRLGGFVIDLGKGVTCKVGGGFSDKQREEYFKNPPIGKIAQIEYKMRTPHGILREPEFQLLREDKDQ